jgi:hypothetical protein
VQPISELIVNVQLRKKKTTVNAQTIYRASLADGEMAKTDTWDNVCQYTKYTTWCTFLLERR